MKIKCAFMISIVFLLSACTSIESRCTQADLQACMLAVDKYSKIDDNKNALKYAQIGCSLGDQKACAAKRLLIFSNSLDKIQK